MNTISLTPMLKHEVSARYSNDAFIKNYQFKSPGYSRYQIAIVFVFSGINAGVNSKKLRHA